MTLAAQRILIIGGGFSGMSAAIACARLGADIDLVEVDPGWRGFGAGISLAGATLRAFRHLGILERFMSEGAAADGVRIHLPHGPQVAEVPTPRIAGADIPGNGGIMRPVLARILGDATRACGANVMLGMTVASLEQDASGVDVVLSDGQRRRYDLVIGADGLYSDTREAVFPNAPKPRYTGQAAWRAVLPRPPEVNGVMMWMGRVKPGLNPVSKDQMYLFVIEHRPTNDFVDKATHVMQLRALLSEFSAPLLQQVREMVDEDSQIVFRPLESLLLPRPWFDGRVVLIGDAAHATTPHLASGACIGIEDALVLAEELSRTDKLPAALDAFQERRWDRCRMVVENSARLGEIEMANGDKQEHARIMQESQLALAQSI